MPRKTSASRARTRRIGLLGLLLPALLTPAGILMGTVTAAALVGGLALHLDRAKPAAPAAPAPAIAAEPIPPQPLAIEHNGETLSLVIAEEDSAGGENIDPFALAGLSHGNLADNGAVHDTPGGRMLPVTSRGTRMPGGGHAPGGTPSSSAHPLRGPATNPPSFGGPAGMPFGGGGSSPAGLQQGSPSAPTQVGGPTQAGGPRSPGTSDPAQPSGEAGAPVSPDDAPSGPQEGEPQTDSQPPHGNPPQQPTQPPHAGMPPNPFPVTDRGSWVPPQVGAPLDPLALPPNEKAAGRPNAVPEPSMMGLILLGVAVMAWAGRRRTTPTRLA